MKISFLTFLAIIFDSLALLAQPVITMQPANQPAIWGGNATFGVTATGVGPLTYQWQLNGTNLPNNIFSTVIGGNLFNNLTAPNTILDSPSGVAVDTSGNLFIADSNNHVIRKLSTNGLATIIAGNGSGSFSGDGGPATNAGLWAPLAVALDGKGNLFIADANNNRIRKVDTNGIITTVAGNGQQGGFGLIGNGNSATNAMLAYPTGVAVDASGNLFIADYYHQCIRKVAVNGVITTVAGNGTAGYTGDGYFVYATSSGLNYPTGVAVDSSGNLFIADTSNHRIRKVITAGYIFTIAGTGIAGYSGDGASATSANINSPYGVFADANQNVFFADTGNHCIRKITNNIITTVVGNGTNGFSGDDGGGSQAMLSRPWTVATDATGNLFVADTGNNRIRRLNTAGLVTTVAGRNLNDGDLAANCTLNAPLGLAHDAFGNLYIADSSNNRIRKMDANGIITTCAGNGIGAFGGDGGPATNASLWMPFGLAVDSQGNLFITDRANHRIRKLDTNGMISTVAGNGSSSFSGDGGEAMSAGMQPIDVAVDAGGNLFIADVLRIRKVNTNGVITTYAGTGGSGYYGDGGPATSATFSAPYSVCVDGSGDLFVGDARVVRRVDTNGIITSIAGRSSAAGGYSGDGGLATNATLSSTIGGVWANAAGNVFISDSANACIRKVNVNGIITTVATNGVFGDSNPGINVSASSFPEGITGDAVGNIYFICTRDNSTRQLTAVDFADQPSFTITNVTPASLSNSYSVTITSAIGSVTSSVVNLTLQLPPIVPAFTATNGTLNLTWSAVSNLTYQLQYATNLIAPVWQNLGSPITATNGTVSASDIPGTDAQGFYRVMWTQ